MSTLDLNRRGAMDSEEAEPAGTTISDLPDDLIARILSFLPALTAVFTSLISRRFRYLWTLSPSATFDFSLFPAYSSPSTTLRFFSLFVDRFLLLRRRSSPLDSFRLLRFPYRDESSRASLDAWILHALSSHARHVTVGFLDSRYLAHYGLPYDLPLSLLRGAALESLSLEYCSVVPPAEPVRLPYLRSLRLESVSLPGSMASDLASSWCPNLEEFRFSGSMGVSELRICSSGLKFLELGSMHPGEDDLGLELDCPALEELSLVWMPIQRVVVIDLSSLVAFRVSLAPKTWCNLQYWRAAMSILKFVPHIKLLETHNAWFRLRQRDVFPSTFVLNNLKHLELRTNYKEYNLLGLQQLLVLCPNLVTMTLHHDRETDGIIFVTREGFLEELLDKPIILNMPNVREIILKQWSGTEEEQNFLDLVMTQGVALEFIRIDTAVSSKTITLGRRPASAEVRQ